jgi:hypothetical protein
VPNGTIIDPDRSPSPQWELAGAALKTDDLDTVKKLAAQTAAEIKKAE